MCEYCPSIDWERGVESGREQIADYIHGMIKDAGGISHTSDDVALLSDIIAYVEAVLAE